MTRNKKTFWSEWGILILAAVLGLLPDVLRLVKMFSVQRMQPEPEGRRPFIAWIFVGLALLAVLTFVCVALVRLWLRVIP